MYGRQSPVTALAVEGKRKKTHDAQFVFKLPKEAKELIRVVAEAEGVTDATIVRKAVAEYLGRRGYDR